MTLETILIWLLIGAIAGWLAGVIVKGYGFGLVGNIVIGILGAIFGGWVFGALGFGPSLGIIGTILGATVGAVLLLLIIKFLRRAA